METENSFIPPNERLPAPIFQQYDGFNFCIGFETRKYSTLPLLQFINKINANKEIGECICEVLLNKEQYIHPYFDIDIKDDTVVFDLEFALQKIIFDFNIKREDIVVASDSRLGKRSWHVIIHSKKIKRENFKTYITKKNRIRKIVF